MTLNLYDVIFFSISKREIITKSLKMKNLKYQLKLIITDLG